MKSTIIPTNTYTELHLLQDDKEALTLTIMFDRHKHNGLDDEPQYDSVDITFEELETLYLAARAYKDA
jgi:hypothetical protein